MKKIRHLLEYAIFLLFRKFLLTIGFKRATNICSFFARKIGPALGVTKIARKNIQETIGKNLSNQELNILIDRLWDHFGRYIAEFVYVDQLSHEEINQYVKLENLHYIEEFIKDKKPFLLCLAHIGNWDFLIRNITTLYPEFTIVYRKANNPYVDKSIINTRSNDKVNLVAKGASGAKDLIQAIKSGHSIAMLVDQKMNDGIEVPFMGKPAMTANAIAKLSIQFNMPIVPTQIVRVKGSHFKAIVYPPLKYNISGDKAKDSKDIMLQINNIIESWVKENPEQWFWFHNRWKK